jgi:hypothetical protein
MLFAYFYERMFVILFVCLCKLFIYDVFDEIHNVQWSLTI